MNQPGQAICNVREAIEGYILALKEDGLPVPEERFAQNFVDTPGNFVSLALNV